ncbi:unnamed protein product [Paramecium sonneborni]|uniref:Transmembrane protein n=1 Tax=Paramecium sonneborni TaxID=65129 RepID=A0A8S1Q2G8_9CILI|nr:unnamed protein product [Paramecium sonneborni]
MKFNIIILSTYLLQALLQSPNSTELCSCEQYFMQKVCDKVSKCSWNQNKNICENLICKNKGRTYCNGYYSDYKCKWNEQKNECIDFETTQCEEITNSIDCLLYKNNCSWTVLGNCESLDCSNDIDCSFERCSFQNGTCSDPIDELNCTKINKDQCDYTRNGKGLICFINDDGECKTYNLSTHNCSQWSDYQFGCQSNECNYKDKSCIQQTCKDKNEENCHYIYQNDSMIQIPCFWSGKECLIQEQVDLTIVSKDDCQKQMTFAWSENQKCEKCIDRQIVQEEESLDVDLIISLTVSIPFTLGLIIFLIWKYKEEIRRFFKIQETDDGCNNQERNIIGHNYQNRQPLS